MININLLIKPKPRLRWPVILGSVTVILLAGALGWATYVGWMQLESGRMVNEQYRGLVADYGAATAPLPKLEQRLNETKERKRQLYGFGRNQRRSQGDWLAAIWQRPAGVTLKEISFTAETVRIAGEADTYAAAMSYLDQLRNLTLVEEMVEEHAVRQDSGKTTFTFLAWSSEEVTQP